MKKKIIITAPTSVIAENFIKYLNNKYDLVTVGRRNSDIILTSQRMNSCIFQMEQML